MFQLVCNPLDAGTNKLGTIIPNPPDNTQVWRWIVANQDLDLVTIPTYVASSHTWVPEATLNPGEGFFVLGGGDFTNTFVGNVLQGSLTNPIAGNGLFQAIGSMVPIGGYLSNVLSGYPATDNDQVWVWLTGNQDLDLVNIPTWIASQNKWSPDYNIPVGDGFFLLRAGAPVNYVRSFTVQ